MVIDFKDAVEAYAICKHRKRWTEEAYYAADLVKSIRTQFTSLSKKDYSSYISHCAVKPLTLSSLCLYQMKELPAGYDDRQTLME